MAHTTAQHPSVEGGEPGWWGHRHGIAGGVRGTLGGMKFVYAFLAESATIPPDGKFYVLGGGFSNVAVPTLPQRIGFAAVATFAVTSEDAGQRHELAVRVVDSTGALVMPEIPLVFEFPKVETPVGRVVKVPAITHCTPMIAQEGLYQVEYWKGDDKWGSTDVYVAAPVVAPVTAPA